MTRTPPSAPCMDCGTDTTPCRDARGCPHHKRHRCKHNSPLPWEWYMVEDEIWALAAGPDAQGFLCIACLEQRLGRPLTGSDFSHRPINIMIGKWESRRLTAAKTR